MTFTWGAFLVQDICSVQCFQFKLKKLRRIFFLEVALNLKGSVKENLPESWDSDHVQLRAYTRFDARCKTMSRSCVNLPAKESFFFICGHFPCRCYENEKWEGELCRASIFAVYMLQPLWWMNRASSLMPTWGCIYLIIFYEIFVKGLYPHNVTIVFSICVWISNALTLNYRIVALLHGIVPLLDCFPKTSLFCVLDVATVLNSRIWSNISVETR